MSPTSIAYPSYRDWFFFYSSVDHPHLHSFPTRRSSDLNAGLQPDPSAGEHRERFDPSTGGRYAGLETLSMFTDRKSTRLNSSHTVISYAVFCLKKKNQRRRSIRGVCGDAIHDMIFGHAR